MTARTRAAGGRAQALGPDAIRRRRLVAAALAMAGTPAGRAQPSGAAAGQGADAAGAVSAAPAPRASGLPIGAPLPAFDLPDALGRRHRHSDGPGQPLALVWVYTMCPYFRKHFESGTLPALMRETAARGVRWLLVESNRPDMRDYFDAKEAADILRRLGAGDTPVLMDDRAGLARAVGAQRSTHSAVFDARGRLAYIGGIDSIASVYPEDIPRATPYLRHALEDLLAARPLRRAQTEAYGCALVLARG